MELTVSVSTVMFLVDPSPPAFPRPIPELNDLLEGAFERRPACGAAEVDLILISPLPPLSLPLSMAAMLGFALIVLLEVVEAVSVKLSGSDMILLVPFSFSRMPSRLNVLGVFGWLISWTVSSVELAPLVPLAGVLIPDDSNESSGSLSVVVVVVAAAVVVCFPSCCSSNCRALCTLIAGIS
jgi:hypothetical protein